MFDFFQKTIADSVQLEGVGLHNGIKVKLILKPLEANSGIVFKRTDVDSSKNLIEADKYYQKALSVNRDCTQLNRAYSKFLINAGEVSKGMSSMYKNFGNIRFGKLNLEIK